jgi:hypothetical protein
MSENCILCLEDIDASENPLECGHKLHIECVKKHFKPECPICRKPLNITVSGTQPELYLPFDPESFINDNYYSNSNIMIYTYENGPIVIYNVGEDYNEQDSSGDNWEEDDDEENPRGDNWEYEDV